ncbi:unnamed protein product [Symbiodinium natans]|uniref:Uncharacterized protein n=1 Tax=Symbiodinium natans TaxID=878477 RepID=A0A812RT43_9DINO|nr:unnamed protein product [Symbiodinium natans]
MPELRQLLSGEGALVADVLPDGQTVDEVMYDVSGGEGEISFSRFRAYLTRSYRSSERPSSAVARGLVRNRTRELEAEQGDACDEQQELEPEDASDLMNRLDDLEEEEEEDEDEEGEEDEGSGLREILVNESDEYQPGATMDDAGQCDGDDESPRPMSRQTPVVDEDMLMAATAPLLIDGTVKKKRKKKKKKKKRRHSKTAVVVDIPAEKKPPVPRFPHPTGPRPEKEAVTPPQAVQTLSERPPLKDRFTKQLLLGRFPKRKPLRVEGADSAAEADGETEADKISPNVSRFSVEYRHPERNT